MLHNGVEFYIFDPFSNNFSEVYQETYISKHKEAYDKLINSLCIPDPNDLLICNSSGTNTFIFYISCVGNDDIINLDEEYEYKFHKSVFFDKKFKDIKKRLIYYYKIHEINVKQIMKEEGNYYITLEKEAIKIVNQSQNNNGHDYLF